MSDKAQAAQGTSKVLTGIAKFANMLTNCVKSVEVAVSDATSSVAAFYVYEVEEDAPDGSKELRTKFCIDGYLDEIHEVQTTKQGKENEVRARIGGFGGDPFVTEALEKAGKVGSVKLYLTTSKGSMGPGSRRVATVKRGF